MSKKCEVKVCWRDSYCKGYCPTHYSWFREHGEKPTHMIGFPTGKRGVKLNPKNWSKPNIAWVAGLLEGEGCWSTHKGSRSGSLQCAMTDKDVIYKLKDIIGGGSIYYRKRPHGWKDVWSYSLSTGSAIYAISCAVYSFMGSRRKAKIREFIADRKYTGATL